MTDQTRPLSGQQAPDPARSYERAKPEAEPGMGRLSVPPPAPANNPDELEQTVGNRQPPRQINAEDEANTRLEPTHGRPQESPECCMPPPEPVDHSMRDEEPDGWDLAPQHIPDPRQRRHPRTEGKGGTP